MGSQIESTGAAQRELESERRPAERPRGRLALVAALATALLLTFAVREIHNVRLGFPEAVPSDPSSWWISDPDSHYHARRLARLLDEGPPVAATDSYLNHPHGAAIPWPPYYTRFLAFVLGPFAPEPHAADAAPAHAADAAAGADFASRLWIEQRIALVPCALAVLTALALGLGAACLLRDWQRARGGIGDASAGALALAALVAGCELAFYNASVQYSAIGIGDHHAFVTCTTAWMFVVLAYGLARVRQHSRRIGFACGLVAGALAGVLLGAWVGGLMYVLIVQATLGILLVASGCGWTRATGPAGARNDPMHAGPTAADPRGMAALAPLGFAFHAAALAVLLPAALASPWKDAFPWMVVNLSWFHPAELFVGALVFMPLLPRRTLGSRFARAWPFAVGLGLVVLGGGSWLIDVGPAAGVREGFAWAGRSNEFMDYITESQPLFGRATGGWDAFFQYLGPGGLLLPLGFAVVAWRAWRARETACLLLLVAAPVMFAQALAQRRFADTLVVPLALMLGWLAYELASLAQPRLQSVLASRARPLVLVGAALVAIGGCALANWRIASDAWQKIFVVQPMQRWARGRGAFFQRETRAQLEWLRTWPDARPGAVLAQWERGHTIEWGADRPSVGTNFGIYVGVDSYLDPWRFLLGEDPAAAERLLVERDARFVQLTAHFARMVPTMLAVLGPTSGLDPGAFYANTDDGAVVFPRLYDTLGLRLALDGRQVAPTSEGLVPVGPSVDFLRLVHVTNGTYPTVFLPFAPGPFPLGFLYEHVPGARIVARGTPGQTLAVELELHYDLERRTHVVHWLGAATVAADGRASVRVPYATDAPNGLGVALGGARWQLGERSGRVDVGEDAVLAGGTIELP